MLYQEIWFHHKKMMVVSCGTSAVKMLTSFVFCTLCRILYVKCAELLVSNIFCYVAETAEVLPYTSMFPCHPNDLFLLTGLSLILYDCASLGPEKPLLHL
jgi:hypothetical protein